MWICCARLHATNPKCTHGPASQSGLLYSYSPNDTTGLTHHRVVLRPVGPSLYLMQQTTAFMHQRLRPSTHPNVFRFPGSTQKSTFHRCDSSYHGKYHEGRFSDFPCDRLPRLLFKVKKSILCVQVSVRSI